MLKEDINKENIRDLEQMIAQTGWPKGSETGAGAANAAFLVIQHAGLARQVKYLPVIRKLCEAKEASWEAYALMYDRVQISSGKKQLYGSQIETDSVTKKYRVSPIGG